MRVSQVGPSTIGWKVRLSGGLILAYFDIDTVRASFISLLL